MSGALRDEGVSEAFVGARHAGTDHVSVLPKKKNPAVGTPGQVFFLSEFTVSVCGLAVARYALTR
jgi:hypothetical protein